MKVKLNGFIEYQHPCGTPEMDVFQDTVEIELGPITQIYQSLNKAIQTHIDTTRTLSSLVTSFQSKDCNGEVRGMFSMDGRYQHTLMYHSESFQCRVGVDYRNRVMSIREPHEPVRLFYVKGDCELIAIPLDNGPEPS